MNILGTDEDNKLDPKVIHLCRKCGYTSYTKVGRAWNFEFDPTLGRYGDLCKSCKTFASMFTPNTVWVYLDDKLIGLDEPKKHQFTLEDEQQFRNLISLGDQVWVSNGKDLWRWGTKVPMGWATFNRINNRWKQLYPKEVGSVEVTKNG